MRPSSGQQLHEIENDVAKLIDNGELQMAMHQTPMEGTTKTVKQSLGKRKQNEIALKSLRFTQQDADAKLEKKIAALQKMSMT